MRKFVTLIMTMSAVPCFAQDTATKSGEAANTASAKRSCRAENPTGSIMSVRICHTKAEWSAIAAARQKLIENRRDSNVVDRSQGGPGNGKGALEL